MSEVSFGAAVVFVVAVAAAVFLEERYALRKARRERERLNLAWREGIRRSAHDNTLPPPPPRHLRVH